MNDNAEFWRKRAEFYCKTCFDLIADMSKGVKIDSVRIDESGIVFTKEQPEQIAYIPDTKKIPIKSASEIRQEDAKAEAREKMGDRLDKAIADMAYILDTLTAFNRIVESGDCNGCMSRMDCIYRPEWGELVRYNCPHYKRDDRRTEDA